MLSRLVNVINRVNIAVPLPSITIAPVSVTTQALRPFYAGPNLRQMSTAIPLQASSLITHLKSLPINDRMNYVKSYIKKGGTLSPAQMWVIGEFIDPREKHRLYYQFKPEYYHGIIHDLVTLSRVLCAFPKEEQLKLLQIFSGKKLCEFVINSKKPIIDLHGLAVQVDREIMECLIERIFDKGPGMGKLKKCFQKFINEGDVEKRSMYFRMASFVMPKFRRPLLIHWAGGESVARQLEAYYLRDFSMLIHTHSTQFKNNKEKVKEQDIGYTRDCTP